MTGKVLMLCSLVSMTVIANDMGNYVGYIIAAKKTIIGYQDDDESDSSFKGCKQGRRIIFEDNTYLTCASYGYQYAYRPDAILLVRNGSWVMIVENDSYDMRNN